MHVSVGFRRGRDEQIRAGRGMKGWREAETAAIAVVRPALTHHTQVVSAASLCEGPVERNLLKPYTQFPSVLITLLGLGTRFGSGMLLIPSRTIFFWKAEIEMDPWDATRRISQRLEICRSTIKPQE